MPVLDNLKNVKIGTTDISDIGDGTCTGAIDSLQDQLNVLTEFKVEDEILYIPNGAGGVSG